MIHVHAEVVRSTNNAVAENKQKRGENVVELDQFKSVLNSYEEPLKELRDSL